MPQYASQAPAGPKRGLFYRGFNNLAKPFALALATFGGSKAYNYLMDGGLTDYLGGRLDSSDWLTGKLGTLSEYETVVMGAVDKIPAAGEYLGRAVDFVIPTDGKEAAALGLVMLGGSLLVDQGMKFSRDPFGYVSRTKNGVTRKLADYTSFARAGAQTYDPHPILAAKKAAGATWRTVRNAYVNVPAFLLNGMMAPKLLELGKELRNGTEYVLARSGTMESVGKFAGYLNEKCSLLPQKDQLIEFVSDSASLFPFLFSSLVTILGARHLRRRSNEKIGRSLQAACNRAGGTIERLYRDDI